MKKNSIMIIDDHTLIRDVWSILLHTNANYEVVANVGDGLQAIEIAREKKPDLVLLDINMTPINGFEILKHIRKHLPGTKIIGLSMYVQPAYAKKMLRGGAKGYVTKNLCREVKNLPVNQIFDMGTVSSCINNLSERQLKIIRHVRDGLSSKEIGEKIQIAASTVQVHRQNILEILKVKNSASLIELANVYGL